jgi:hypothetical protein
VGIFPAINEFYFTTILFLPLAVSISLDQLGTIGIIENTISSKT